MFLDETYYIFRSSSHLSILYDFVFLIDKYIAQLTGWRSDYRPCSASPFHHIWWWYQAISPFCLVITRTWVLECLFAHLINIWQLLALTKDRLWSFMWALLMSFSSVKKVSAICLLYWISPTCLCLINFDRHTSPFDLVYSGYFVVRSRCKRRLASCFLYHRDSISVAKCSFMLNSNSMIKGKIVRILT